MFYPPGSASGRRRAEAAETMHAPPRQRVDFDFDAGCSLDRWWSPLPRTARGLRLRRCVSLARVVEGGVELCGLRVAVDGRALSREGLSRLSLVSLDEVLGADGHGGQLSLHAHVDELHLLLLVRRYLHLDASLDHAQRRDLGRVRQEELQHQREDGAQ